MKLSIILCIASIISFACTKNTNLRSSNTKGLSSLEFADSTNNIKRSLNKNLEVVVSKKEIPVSKFNYLRFKEKDSSEMTFENPVMIKDGIGVNTHEDLSKRVALITRQSYNNYDAYDTMYPTHKSYYENKKFYIFDPNFKKIEDDLLNQFNSVIETNILDRSKLQDVEKIKQFNVKPSNVYLNHNYVASTDVSSPEYLENGKTTISDPYRAMYPNDK